MRAIRSRDTAPELAVRRLLHAQGLRYRVDLRPEPTLRRRADIVFTKQRIAIFIDGCFWHGCPEHGRVAFAHNQAYWPDKIQGNIERDRDTTMRLTEAGWLVLRFWEHQDAEAVTQQISKTVYSARG